MPEPEIKTLEVKSVNDKYKEASDKQKAKDKAESFRKDEEKGCLLYTSPSPRDPT